MSMCGTWPCKAAAVCTWYECTQTAFTHCCVAQEKLHRRSYTEQFLLRSYILALMAFPLELIFAVGTEWSVSNQIIQHVLRCPMLINLTNEVAGAQHTTQCAQYNTAQKNATRSLVLASDIQTRALHAILNTAFRARDAEIFITIDLQTTHSCVDIGVNIHKYSSLPALTRVLNTPVECDIKLSITCIHPLRNLSIVYTLCRHPLHKSLFLCT